MSIFACMSGGGARTVCLLKLTDRPEMNRLVAAAKVNLCLHVGRRRADGLHELASLVVRANFGDTVSVAAADGLELVVRGRNAAALKGTGNLILTAAHALDPAGGAHVELDKELPIGAGLGGGSADAAAAMILLNYLWGCGLSTRALAARAMVIGADIPACLAGASVVVSGAGEIVVPARVPELHAVLVDTGARVSTASVYAAFDGYGPLEIDTDDIDDDPASVVDWLASRTRNDLTEAALSVEPGIAEALHVLASDEDVLLARMSGSGGACFGLCAAPDRTRAVRKRILSRHPNWWVRDCVLGSDPDDRRANPAYPALAD